MRYGVSWLLIRDVRHALWKIEIRLLRWALINSQTKEKIVAFRSAWPAIRERIYSYGSGGSGKSYDYYTIARRAIRTKSDAHFHIVDTDESVWRMLIDPYWSDVLLTTDGNPIPQLHIHNVTDLNEATEALEKIKRDGVTGQDWTLIDLFSQIKDWSSRKYIRETRGKDASDYLLEVRQKQVAAKQAGKKSGETNMELLDYNVINYWYGDLADLVKRWPSNLFVTATSKPFDNFTSEAIKAEYGRIGSAPGGDKGDPHLFQTVLAKRAQRNGQETQWTLSTVKDRSRPMLMGNICTDFSKDYLIDVAGWKPI